MNVMDDDPRVQGRRYVVAHEWVRYVRGKASEYVCSCGKPAHHWAYDHADPFEERVRGSMPFSMDARRYQPMCTMCHWELDRHGQPEASSVFPG